MLKEICKKYFDNISEKNIDNLKMLYAEDIYLKDWNVEISGKKQVLDENNKLFNQFNSIQIIPINIYQDGDTVLAELQIYLNSTELLLVMDVITFDEKGKICCIHAYKGN